MKGYALAYALNSEADEIATESRAQLVRDASKEIENLILQNLELLNALIGIMPYALEIINERHHSTKMARAAIANATANQ